IVDSEGRIIVMFVGTPEDPEWPAVVAKAMKAMRRAREKGLMMEAFAGADVRHRRGDYYTLTGGVSFGGGQKCPGNLNLPRKQRRLFEKLLNNKYVRRICGFQSSAFRSFAPKLFDDYLINLQALFESQPELRLNFTNSIFPTATFNLGPQSVSFDHFDHHNRAMGLCAVTNNGNFNHKTSAHFYMKQLKLVVDFPPAATTLIPSAIIEHGNTPLASEETRYSITQYAAGGLFRWVKYGFKSAKQLLQETDGRRRKAVFDGADGQRAREGLDLFSRWDELVPDRTDIVSIRQNN
ncbi:hypothetical protein C8R43DRAFT_900074, partial [Mycena crocata]